MCVFLSSSLYDSRSSFRCKIVQLQIVKRLITIEIIRDRIELEEEVLTVRFVVIIFVKNILQTFDDSND